MESRILRRIMAPTEDEVINLIALFRETKFHYSSLYVARQSRFHLSDS